MFNRRMIIASALIIFAQPNIWAQSPLSMSATLGGGLLSPISSDIRGDIYSAYDYPLSNLSFAVNGKLLFSLSAVPFDFVGSVSYNSLFDTAILPVATSSGTVNEKFTYSLSVLAIGIGGQYSFLPTPIFKPYASFAASLNLINGNAYYENNVIPESKLNSATRIGIDLGIGVSIETPFLPVDIEVKYRLANPFGKIYDNNGPPLPGFGGLPQTSTYSLNDAANPNDNQDEARSINYLTIVVGFNFNIF